MITDKAGNKYLLQNFDQAIAFLQSRGWQFMKGKKQNPWCNGHSCYHTYGFLHQFVGVYNGFNKKKDVTAWAQKLCEGGI
jgi:hypothetical protein